MATSSVTGFAAWASASRSPGGEWHKLAPAPTKRTEVAAAALDGKIYVLGGFAELSFSNIGSYSVSNSVEVYDPEADRWTNAAPLPARLHHAGAVVHGDRLYVVGGFTPKLLAVWSPVATTYSYDPGSDSWVELSPMPTARGALGVAVLDGKIHAVGGIGENGDTGVLEVYDPATDRWMTKAPLPTARDHLAAAAVGGLLYAIGGRLNGSYANNVGLNDVYDPATDRWSSRAPLPTPRSGIAAGVVGGMIYVVGGEAPEGTFRTNEVYRPSSNTWSEAAAMPTARHGLGVAVVEDHLYVLSGGPTPGGSYSNVNERYDHGPARLSRTGGRRASPAQVGAVMALLATFQDADVLPPESSPDANRLIRALIQSQAAFMKSTNSSVNRLLADALAHNAQAEGLAQAEAVDRVRTRGWNSHSLEAVVEYMKTNRVWDDPDLVEGFRAYNIGPTDFDLLADTFFSARESLSARGQDLHIVYASRRREMPGAML